MTNKERDRQWSRIRQHGLKLLAIYPEAIEKEPAALCRVLRIWEGKAHTIALRLCNGPEYPGGYEQVDKLCEAILEKVRAILGPGPAIFINRDPRGYALKIRSEDAVKLDIEKDWGGYGLIAPEITGKE